MMRKGRKVRSELLIGVLMASFFFIGCKKKWKEPTEVDLSFDMEQQESQGQSQSKGEIEFNKGDLRFSQIRITGDRKEADDIDFTRDEKFSVSVPKGGTSKNIKFDIPQGTYTSFDIELRMNKEGKGNNSIQLIGIGHFPSQTPPKKVLKVSIPRSFNVNIPVRNNNGGRKVELIAGNPRNLEMEVDLSDWFETISESMWNNATTTGNNNSPVIMVDPQQNEKIYNKVVDRIKNGFKARLQ